METLKSSLNPETHFGGEEFDKSKINHLVAKFKLKNPKNVRKNKKTSFTSWYTLDVILT